MSIESFRRGIRSSVRALWSGVIDSRQFAVSMQAAIGRGIANAWEVGASEGGITPDEYSTDEQKALAEFLTTQYESVGEFGVYIVSHNKKSGKPLEPLLSRAEMWVNQYESARMRAAAMAAGNEKRVWTLGATKVHCPSCKKLEGIVKRYSFWLEHVMPRSAPNDGLECGGYRCQCELRKTRKPTTPGALPRLP